MSENVSRRRREMLLHRLDRLRAFVAAALSFPVMTHLVFADGMTTVLSIIIASLVLWAHRGNIKRLLSGTENKFHFHVDAPKPGEEA